jgi:tetratricopeptide (TPR) repeat protein
MKVCVESIILTLASLSAMLLSRTASAFSTSSNPWTKTMNLYAIHHDVADMTLVNNDYDTSIIPRRQFMKTLISSICLTSSTLMLPSMAMSDDAVQITAKGDVAKLFNEARAFEAQGNILVAQRLYLKVTNIAPRFIYGWSNLGNTLVAQGQLSDADNSYSKAVSLCEESLKQTEDTFGTRRCDDLYLILLNRGSVRLNNDMPKEALSDLTKSYTLRGRPDATVLQT